MLRLLRRPASVGITHPDGGKLVAGVRRPFSTSREHSHTSTSPLLGTLSRTELSDGPLRVLQSYAAMHESDPTSNRFFATYPAGQGQPLRTDSPGRTGLADLTIARRSQSPDIAAVSRILQDMTRDMGMLRVQVTDLVQGQASFAQKTAAQLSAITGSLETVLGAQNRHISSFTQNLADVTRRIEHLETAVGTLTDLVSRAECPRPLSPRLAPRYPGFSNTQ